MAAPGSSARDSHQPRQSNALDRYLALAYVNRAGCQSGHLTRPEGIGSSPVPEGDLEISVGSVASLALSLAGPVRPDREDSIAMARRNASIPSALQMRELKYGEQEDAKRRMAVAEALRTQGRHSEALLLFERHIDALNGEAEIEWAVRAGDSFHLLSVQRIGVAVAEEHFRSCAKRALEKGRVLDARQCLEAVGDQEAIRALADDLPPSLRPDAGEDEDEEDQESKEA